MIIKVATSKCGGGTTAATDAAMEGRADCGLGLGVCGTFLRYSTCKYTVTLKVETRVMGHSRLLEPA